jgi:CubicO group peptidase (beta-lactamase class C family)
MKQLVSLVAVVACLWSASVVGQDLVDHPEVASQIKLMDAWIQAQMKEIDLPGLVIGVVHDQEVVWSKAYGHADVERGTPMQSDSIFRIASHSKLFTSIAILQLRDAGKLRLDDPITDHLPWFDMHNPYLEAEPVRIWNLLTHSAGLPRESDHPSWTEFEFPTGEELRETVSEQQATYPAATVWKYSNLGLSLAGAIVETVSGRDYEEYVETEIMAPLGMTSSSVGVPSDVHRVRLVTGYSRRWPDKPREAMPFIDARAFDPATGLSSSVDDMLMFLSWQMRLRAGHVTEVLAANTLREMQRVHWLREDWRSGNGWGFAISHREDRDLIGHGGGYPGNRTNTQLSPKENVGVVVFTNGDEGNPGRYVNKAFEWIAPAIVRATARPTPLVTTDPSWTQYVGMYRSPYREQQVMVLNEELVVILPLSDDPMTGKSILRPLGEHIFRIEGTGGGPHGELARFELDADGNVTRLYMGVNYLERVP